MTAAASRRAIRALALVLVLFVGGASAPALFAQRVVAEAPPAATPPVVDVPTSSGLEVALVTIGPGEIYWERFGHNAIVIRDTASGAAKLYHFGIFDFESENFLLNFLRGYMTYLAVGEPLRGFDAYLGAGRALDVQWLALTQVQAAKLRAHLEWHIAPENARYRYDYFERNCSTKIRDALDLATDGAVRAAFAGRSRGVTYRWHTQRLTAPEAWLYLGTHAGLAGYADRTLTFWDEAFIPMELARRLREVTLAGADGGAIPLVRTEQSLAQATIAQPPESPPRRRWAFALAGLAIGALALVLARRKRGAFAALAAALWFVAGIGGLVFAALWLGTEHRAAWANENLLLFNPLALVLLLHAPVRRWREGRAARTIAWIVVACAAFALLSKALPGFVQDNLDWILLWLPIHLALATGLKPRTAA